MIQKQREIGKQLYSDVDHLLTIFGIGGKVSLKIKGGKYPREEDFSIKEALSESIISGYLPTSTEQEKLERANKNIKFWILLDLSLDDKNKINWLEFLGEMGDALVKYKDALMFCYSEEDFLRWKMDLTKTKEVTNLAKTCFQKIVELLKDQPLRPERIEAEEKIRETDEALKKISEEIKAQERLGIPF